MYSLFRWLFPRAQAANFTAMSARTLVADDAADLTEQTILDLSGEDELCQVRELVLREHGLSEVGPLLERLTALEVLSLSNNNVHSLAGCASMGRLTTLNINFNRIASLEPLSNCPLLEKLFASSNKISTVAPLAACMRLKELSLFRNLVVSLDATLAVLKQLPALRVLDLGANPCALGPPYRHRIVSTLSLECLDGDPLTELDSELAADFGASSDASGQRVVAASADTRGASGAGSPSRRPTTAPAPHSKSLFRAPGSQNRAARRRKGRLAHTAPFSREPPRQRAVAAWGVVAAWEPWLAQASVAGVAGDPFLNSNAILLDYLSQAELEQADPPSVPADAASLSGGAEGACSLIYRCITRGRQPACAPLVLRASRPARHRALRLSPCASSPTRPA